MLVLVANHGEMNQVSLSERLAVNPSTAFRMADRLVDAGFVSRRVNPESRREVLLQLTVVGRMIVDEVISRRRQEIAGIVTRMPQSERAGLVLAMRAFAEAGGEMTDDERERDLLSLGWD
jgi:DNA-binding MarR family transcriptional regulator